MKMEQSLAKKLADRGITYERDKNTEWDQRMTWRRADGSILGRFDVHEGWGQIRTWERQKANRFYRTVRNIQDEDEAAEREFRPIRR